MYTGAADYVAPPPVQLTESGKKVCMACAEEVQPAAVICPHCRLNPDTAPIPEKKDISRHSIISWIVITFALMLIMKGCVG